MRKNPSAQVEAGRIKTGPLASDHSYGCYGQFEVKHPLGGKLRIVASAADADDPLAEDWEHVSVSLQHRCPRWEEMNWVKQQFWTADELVIQFHPPDSNYISIHPYTLHLWRPRGIEIPLPPALLV